MAREIGCEPSMLCHAHVSYKNQSLFPLRVLVLQLDSDTCQQKWKFHVLRALPSQTSTDPSNMQSQEL